MMNRPTLSILLLLLASVPLDAFQFTPAPMAKPAFAATNKKESSSAVTKAEEGEASTSETDEELETMSLSPVLQGIVDERREYQMNVGKAMDVLRHDMRDILTETPGRFCVMGSVVFQMDSKEQRLTQY